MNALSTRDPLAVTTNDGTAWTRRAVTRGGRGLYAPSDVKGCPQFVMATLDELAEHGLQGQSTAERRMSARGAAIRAVEAHPSTTFMAPCESLADAVLAAAGPLLRAEVLREAADLFDSYGRSLLDGGIMTAAEVAEKLREYAGRVTPAGGEITQPAELTIYRASHEAIVMGRYTTAAAARKHCEAYVRREHTGSTDLRLWWREDEDTVDQPEEGVAELIESTGPHSSRPTGYVVTPLTVASEYDEEADE